MHMDVLLIQSDRGDRYPTTQHENHLTIMRGQAKFGMTDDRLDDKSIC